MSVIVLFENLTSIFIFYSLFLSSSAINCKADKNGIHYMVFTRVILGNVEPLHCRSEQWHPSYEKYDSGVDDLDNPTHYVIWNMNMNTHIYLECVVNFRIPPGAEGTLQSVY